jgi:predicted short-subunit dehydrogenase-like oxidoreductase (DUF2520 family)
MALRGTLKAMDSRGRVVIIGAGRVGTAMSRLLSSRGYAVIGVADPSPSARERAASLSGSQPTEDPVAVAEQADIVLITTPDGMIERTCRFLADSGMQLSGKKFIHMSGALSLEALGAARRSGAEVLSVHPLQTFADLQGALDALPGSSFGVTCDPELREWAAQFVSDLDGRVQFIEDSDKVLYHAAAVLASNALAMVEYGAESIARELGFSDEDFAAAFMPLARATLDNVGRLGPAGALTGPLARGDVGTIKEHLLALEGFNPELAAMYRAVCLWGLNVVSERGEVEPEVIEEMRKLLRSDLEAN